MTTRRRPVYPNTYLLKPNEQTNVQWIADYEANEFRFLGLLCDLAPKPAMGTVAAERLSLQTGVGFAVGFGFDV